MKKTISLIVLAMCLVFALTGCKVNSNKTSYDKNEFDKIFYSQMSQSLGISEEQIISTVLKEENLEEKALKSAHDMKKECGDFVSFKTEKADYSLVNGEINGTVEIKCSKRNMLATATFKMDEEHHKWVMSSLSYEGVYSTGEKLGQAASNTAIGMGTVFAVLIFIYLVISLFKFIPQITAIFTGKKAKRHTAPVVLKKYKHKEKDKQNDTENKQKAIVDNVAQEDDGELVAVIAAAIAASTGQATDSFVVRSIRRRY